MELAFASSLFCQETQMLSQIVIWFQMDSLYVSLWVSLSLSHVDFLDYLSPKISLNFPPKKGIFREVSHPPASFSFKRLNFSSRWEY